MDKLYARTVNAAFVVHIRDTSPHRPLRLFAAKRLSFNMLLRSELG